MARRRLFLNHNLNRKRKTFQGSDGKKETKTVSCYIQIEKPNTEKEASDNIMSYFLSLPLSLNCPGLTNCVEAYHYCICTGKSRASVVHSLASNQTFMILVSQLCYFSRKKGRTFKIYKNGFTQHMLVFYSSNYK